MVVYREHDLVLQPVENCGADVHIKEYAIVERVYEDEGLVLRCKSGWSFVAWSFALAHVVNRSTDLRRDRAMATLRARMST